MLQHNTLMSGQETSYSANGSLNTWKEMVFGYDIPPSIEQNKQQAERMHLHDHQHLEGKNGGQIEHRITNNQ
jgi:hypothetical protein